MKRFVKFEHQRYKDGECQVFVMIRDGVIEDEIAEKCYEYAERINNLWDGGTFIFKGVMDKEEAQDWVNYKSIREAMSGKENYAENIQRLQEIYNQTYNN